MDHSEIIKDQFGRDLDRRQLLDHANGHSSTTPEGREDSVPLFGGRGGRGGEVREEVGVWTWRWLRL